MIQRDNGYRYKDYHNWNYNSGQFYDYKRFGLLNRLLPVSITKSENEIIKIILKYIEGSLIYIMDYVEIIKEFKNAHWKNR